MKLILGLGNPGLRYRCTRHNLGFLVVEALAKAKRIKMPPKAFNCRIGQGRVEDQEVLLAKPLTFMNLSGEAVLAIVKRKKIKLTDLLVICDDINLPLGKIRIRTKGSDGGHKGLRSIIEALGSGSFPRLRIGVGMPRPETEKYKFRKHVLGRFNKKETKIITAAVEEAVAASETWARDGIVSAMDRFN